jgi:glucose/mannose-6-phosphate isomerase
VRSLIAELPEQLRWAASLDVPEIAEAEEALVVGMGGSGIAGDVAVTIAENAGRRVAVHKSYGLPSWAKRVDPLVVLVSHSGDTEETMSAAAAAISAGIKPGAVATGGRLGAMAAERNWPTVAVPTGPQPRAAIGYLAGGVLRLLEGAGILPALADDLTEAAEVIERLLGDGDGPAVALAADLAEALEDRVAVIYGEHGLAVVAATRWKTQLNENGKAPAYWSVLPELDHNEIVGWDAFPDLGRDRIGVVTLCDREAHPRVALRAKLTIESMESKVSVAGVVEAQGESALARLFSLILVGDLLSVAVAERAGIDPMAVEPINALKRRLSEEDG